MRVHDQQGVDAGIAGARQVAVDDERVAGRPRCDDHPQLVKVRCQRLAAATAVGAAQHVATRQPLGDRPLIVAGSEQDPDAVARDQIDALALELAGDPRAVRALHDDAAPVGLDDAAGVLAIGHGVATTGAPSARRRSIRAAGGGCESWNAEYNGSGVSVVALSL